MQDETIIEVKRKSAKSLYTSSDADLKDVALEVGVDEATMLKWATEEAWDGMKRSQLTSKKIQIEHTYKLLRSLNTKMNSVEEVTEKELNLYVKLTAAINNLEKDVSAPNTIEVTGNFIKWVRRRDSMLAQKLSPYVDSFINNRLSAGRP
jgi:hypothetical protein